MAVIYFAITLVGAQKCVLFETSENGGISFAQITLHYLASVGLFVLAATVILIISSVSFIAANFGLNDIITLFYTCINVPLPFSHHSNIIIFVWSFL